MINALNPQPVFFSSGTSHVSDHLSTISANLETSLTVEAIAAGVGVSPSTLFKTFKHQLDITPMQFVKRQKLEAAWECLIKACPKTITVTEVALRYGFWNVGRFSKEYRQVFQESPAATLRR